MPKVSTIKTNFTAGELSERLLARVDISKYPNGAKELYNAYPLVHGGARSRNGSKYTAAAKIAAKQTRIVPFVFSRTQAFLIELGELYIRFFSPAGQIVALGTPVEVISPWDDAELDDLKYVQSADTMFIAHPTHAMRKLVRFSNTVWKLSTVTWEVPPSEEIGERPTTTLTLSATSGGAVTGTAAAAAFEASDVGRYVESGAGRGNITAIGGGGTTATLSITAADAFASVGPIAAGAWKITESPKTPVTPSAVGPVGATITLTAGAAAFKNLAANVHIGSYIEMNDGLVELSGYTDTTHMNAVVRTELSSLTAAPSGAWLLRQVAWNSVDGYPSAVGLYQQRLIAGGTTNFPNYVWGTRTGEYLNFADGTDDADGFVFPLASDQLDVIEHLPVMKRIHPLTQGAEWSLSGGVEKPLAPTNVKADPETPYGCSFVRPVRVGNELIMVDVGGKTLRAIGYRAENDNFNAPDISVLSEHITGDGVYDMTYQKGPDKVIWLVRADGLLVSCSIDRDQEAIGFARHETDGFFESVAVIPQTDGTGEQLWAVVVREVNGSTVRYIERFEEGLETDCCLTGAVTENAVTGAAWAAGVLTLTRAGHGYATEDTIRLSAFTSANDVEIDGEYEITVTGANTYTVELDDDPGVIGLGTDAKAASAWAGYGHLAAKQVDIVQDGYVGKQQTVSAGGVVTLARAAYAVEIGLHFEARIVTLPPEVQTGTGTAQGNAISIHEIIVRFYKTRGGKINGQPINSREFGPNVLNQPVPEFTGDRSVENLGWGKTGGGDSDGTVTLLRDQPLHMQALGVITRMTVNDG